MDKQTKPLESDAGSMPGGPPSRGMLARIRKATGEFDFTALMSGSRRSAGSAPARPSTTEGHNMGVPAGAYDPIYRGDSGDASASLAKLWNPAPPKETEPELIPIPS